MSKPVFKDTAIDFEEQVALLERQGLVIHDRRRAVHILQNVSYSRLKAYFVPLMARRSPRAFRSGASFEQAYAIYGFDRRLRELIFHEMEKIEISIRTRMGYAARSEEGGYWYLNPRYFRSAEHHRELVRRITNEVKRSDIDAIKRFYEKYSNPLPPCWMALEATSMGTLSFIYDELTPGPVKSHISGYYGVSDTVFSSWLHHLLAVRNSCAHHSRLWNKKLHTLALIPVRTPERFPEQPPSPDCGTQKVYTTLCIIKYLQNTVKPTNTFAERLKTLVFSYPQIDITEMGFPIGWASDPFWRQAESDTI